MEPTINHVIRKRNRQRIFEFLMQTPSSSKQELVTELGLSLPTVTQNLIQLTDDGLVRESGTVQNTGGRNARAYSVIPEARAAVGLDIAADHVTAVVLGLNGTLLKARWQDEPFRMDKSYFKRLGSLVERVLNDAEIGNGQVLGVGIAVPGLISEDRQTVVYGEILDITGAGLDDFAEFIAYPCMFCHDSDSAGLAEVWNQKQLSNAFYLMLGNNIGGSVLMDNQVYHGQNNRAGEVGHMTVVPDGKPCYCGQFGCLECYCSAQTLTQTSSGNLMYFFEQLRHGGKEQSYAWNNYLRYLSIAVNNLRMLFDCDIILGGYVGVYLKDYLDELRALVRKRSTFSQDVDYVRACGYRTEPVATGAALPYIQQFLENV